MRARLTVLEKRLKLLEDLGWFCRRGAARQ
jgi:hypothetical protein